MADKAPKVPKEPKAPKENFEGVIASMNAVIKVVEELSDLIKENIEKSNHPIVVSTTNGSFVDSVPGAVIAPIRTQPNGLPLPTEYISIMEEVLNKKFDMQVEYMPDTSAFELAVLVPQEYSNAGKAHWDMYHEDRRSKVIENALGVTGVREWMNMIYENFGMETKSKISFDRSQI